MPKYINGIKVDIRVEDLTGQRLGRLTVVRLIGRKKKTKDSRLYWLCECECGNTKEIMSANLLNGSTTSCGCYGRERSKDRNFSHGMAGSKEYITWAKIKERVFNPKSKHFEKYSKLGMSEELANDFTKFLEEVGYAPPEKDGRVTIDRIDNNMGYVKGNMRWVGYDKQARNRGRISSNTSGVTGVSKTGGGKSWGAFWTDSYGKLRSKSFSINKYGDELAFFLACETRLAAIERMNMFGAGYTENHGK